MSTKVTTSTNQPPATGYTQAGNQPLAGEGAQTIANSSVGKGGMRGIGLAVVLIAEAVLKKKAADLAEDYLKLNKRDYQSFIDVHQGKIADTAAEAMSASLNPVYVPDFYAAAASGMAKSSIVDKQWFEVRRRIHRYAVGLQRRVDYDFALLRMHGIVAGWNVGRRYEMTYADEHNNRRFDRKIEVANIGLGISNIVTQGLASSVKGVASSYDSLGDTVSSIGNGLAANSWYKAGREDAAKRFPERGPKADKQSTPKRGTGPE